VLLTHLLHHSTEVTEYWAPLIYEQSGEQKPGSKSQAATTKEQKQQGQKAGDRAQAKAKSSPDSAVKSDSKVKRQRRTKPACLTFWSGKTLSPLS
jgi:hypothetical protein